MKKIYLLPFLLTILLRTASAQEYADVYGFIEEKPQIPSFSFSARFGGWEILDQDILDTRRGFSGDAQIRICLGTPYVSVVGRFSHATANLQEYQESFSNFGYYSATIRDGDCNLSNASGELRIDLFPYNTFNVYLSGGAYWEQFEADLDLRGEYMARRDFLFWSYWYIDYDFIYLHYEEDGIAPVGHIGFECRPGNFYCSAEVGVIGKIYEEDRIKVEMRGIFGYKITSNLRIDALVRYLSQENILWYTAGLTFEF